MKGRTYLTFVPIAALGAMLVGCGGGDAESDATPQAAEGQAPTDPAAASGSAAVNTALATADKAMKNRDYTTAAESLIRVQVSNSAMTEKQAFDHVNRMRDLSRQIADAAASGDPRAMQAAELMKRYQALRTTGVPAR